MAQIAHTPLLNLDATEYASYSGSGTTWTDLSQSPTNATLVNTPTYTKSNGGAISFDGTNDYAYVTLASPGTKITLEFYMRINSDYINDYLFNFGTSSALYSVNYQFGFGFATNANDCYGIAYSDISTKLWRKWKHVVFVMNSNVSYTNNKIYIDGELQTLSQQAGTENAGNRTFNSGYLQFGGAQFGSANVDISVFRVYNRELSLSEILQNFNAIKTRSNLFKYDSIITPRNGMFLCYDIGNANCYRAENSNVSDTELIHNLRSGAIATRGTGTLAPYYSDSGGYLAFAENGTENHYYDFTCPGITSAITTVTVEMWMYPNQIHYYDATNKSIFLGWYQYFIGSNTAGDVGFSTDNSGDIYGVDKTVIDGLFSTGHHTHWVFEMRSDVSYTNNKMYINGTLQTLSQQSGTENATNRTFNSGQGRFPGYRLGSDSSFRAGMYLAMLCIYNRALTQAEVTENYNKNLSRFTFP